MPPSPAQPDSAGKEIGCLLQTQVTLRNTCARWGAFVCCFEHGFCLALWTSPAEKTGSAVFSASPPKNRRGVVGFLSGDLAFFKQEFYPLLVAYYPEQVVSQKYNRGIRVQYALSISFYTYYESVGAFSYSGVFY